MREAMHLLHHSADELVDHYEAHCCVQHAKSLACTAQRSTHQTPGQVPGCSNRKHTRWRSANRGKPLKVWPVQCDFSLIPVRSVWGPEASFCRVPSLQEGGKHLLSGTGGGPQSQRPPHRVLDSETRWLLSQQPLAGKPQKARKTGHLAERLPRKWWTSGWLIVQGSSSRFLQDSMHSAFSVLYRLTYLPYSQCMLNQDDQCIETVLAVLLGRKHSCADQTQLSSVKKAAHLLCCRAL